MDIFEVVGLRDGGPAGSWQPADDLSSNPAEVYSSFRYENIKNSQKELAIIGPYLSMLKFCFILTIAIK